MGDYLRIARVYLRGTAAAVWLFLFLCLLSISANAGDRGQPRWHPWRRPFEKIIHGNVCVFQCLSIRRPSQRQHGPPVGVRAAALSPEASPGHYAHRIVFPGDPDVLDGVCGNQRHRPTSVAVIFLTCLAAGLWTLHHPLLGFLAFPFLAFAMTPSSSNPDLAVSSREQTQLPLRLWYSLVW